MIYSNAAMPTTTTYEPGQVMAAQPITYETQPGVTYTTSAAQPQITYEAAQPQVTYVNAEGQPISMPSYTAQPQVTYQAAAAPQLALDPATGQYVYVNSPQPVQYEAAQPVQYVSADGQPIQYAAPPAMTYMQPQQLSYQPQVTYMQPQEVSYAPAVSYVQAPEGAEGAQMTQPATMYSTAPQVLPSAPSMIAMPANTMLPSAPSMVAMPFQFYPQTASYQPPAAYGQMPQPGQQMVADTQPMGMGPGTAAPTAPTGQPSTSKPPKQQGSSAGRPSAKKTAGKKKKSGCC